MLIFPITYERERKRENITFSMFFEKKNLYRHLKNIDQISNNKFTDNNDEWNLNINEMSNMADDILFYDIS